VSVMLPQRVEGSQMEPLFVVASEQTERLQEEHRNTGADRYGAAFYHCWWESISGSKLLDPGLLAVRQPLDILASNLHLPP